VLIGIDAHMVGTRETGNETYCRGLIEGLGGLRARGEAPPDQQYAAYLAPSARVEAMGKVPEVACRVLPLESSVWRLLWGYGRVASADHLDLLHVTYTLPAQASGTLRRSLKRGGHVSAT
jgi:hypothetical protein